MKKPNPKIRAATWSIATASSLGLVKLVIGLATGSMAVLASAIDSLLDILMSGVNYLAIRQAEQPADPGHPFGHGKFETIAALVQALIIALSGLWILYEAIRRLLVGVELTRLGGGIVVLLAAAAVSWVLSRYLRRVARETDSSALHADSLHFAMDVYTNLALMAGLGAVALFNTPWLDPVLSILVALYILYEALQLIRYGLRDVLDAELPGPLRAEISRVIEAHRGDLVGYHNLRTRRAGSQKIMDFHLTVCKDLSVEEAHRITEELEDGIRRKIPGADVIIHVEPCHRADCPGRERCPEVSKDEG